MTIRQVQTESLGDGLCGESLLAPEVYPHAIERLELIETHISWIVLTGKFAYKIKKPVDLGFVDYTSLEKRKNFCELEVKLNRRFAPGLYLGVIPISKTAEGYRMGDIERDSPSNPLPEAVIVDYAVKMKQFPQDAIVATRLDNPVLTTEAVETFGKHLADFHDSLDPVDPTLPFVQPRQITNDAIDNFGVLLDLLSGDPRFERLKRLESWTHTHAQSLQAKFKTRLRTGKIRRCHGDLHLKNIIQLDGRILAFDGIEFNQAFQCVDILSEIAFPIMDFWARGRADLAWRLANSYLEQTGDYVDLDVLRFYIVYRAMVRAKVAWLNPGNHSEQRRQEYASPEFPADPFAGPWDKFIRAAEQFAFQLKPELSITHGFSGSGKSTVAMNVISHEGGIRIRSDVERHRLFGGSGTDAKYSKAMSDRVYSKLLELSTATIVSGFPVVIDATFLKKGRRKPFQDLAGKLNVDYRIIDCDVPFEELCRRLRLRRNDPSEADIDVLTKQIQNHDPLSDEELPHVFLA